MPNSPLVALVTGANKGIGLEIVRQLVLQLPDSPLAQQLSASAFLIYLTARNEERGHAALASLESDPALKHLKRHGGPVDLHFRQLDIASESSIRETAAWLKERHPEGLDLLVQNAGIATKGSRFDASVVKETLATNYDGFRMLFAALQIKPQGRVVNMSSMASMLTRLSPTLADQFRQAKTVPAVTELMQDFRAAVDKGDHKEAGWPSQAYAVSKMGVTALTRAQAAEDAEAGGRRLINAVCPGWIKTDMTSHRGPGTVQQGADTPVWLALGDIDFSGQFMSERKPVDW